jgi:hypothetical protein
MQHEIPVSKPSNTRANIALFVSILGTSVSLYYSSRAYDLSYEVALPVITTSIEVVEPIQVGKPVILTAVFENKGHSTARDFQLDWRGPKSRRADLPFVADFSGGQPQQDKMDLQPEGKRTFMSTKYFSLEHDYDLAAVLSGRYRLFTYGKATFVDFRGRRHELHFCRFYSPDPTSPDPLKLPYCEGYNENK